MIADRSTNVCIEMQGMRKNLSRRDARNNTHFHSFGNYLVDINGLYKFNENKQCHWKQIVSARKVVSMIMEEIVITSPIQQQLCASKC